MANLTADKLQPKCVCSFTERKRDRAVVLEK